MRKISKKQMPLMPPRTDHPQANELNAISCIIDANPTIYDLAMQDLSPKGENTKKGANGMTAEQVVRAAIVKQIFQISYKDLAFHIIDSNSLRRFCFIGIADKGFKKSALCNNVKKISPETWEAINRCLVHYAKEEGIEKGREVRIDCTVVESNIHAPSDSTLLWDSVRVLTRLLNKAKEFYPRLGIVYQNHTRRAKRRMLNIQYAKKKEQRKSQYLDLLKVTHNTIEYARNAIDRLQYSSDITALMIFCDLKQTISLVFQVIEQTEKRVLQGLTVPASEKIVSIFEPHTDIIIKDRRDIFYGHKICLTGGRSNLITDCTIEKGNPADTELVKQMLNRQNEIYGQFPLKTAFDGGFASLVNLDTAKGLGVKDVCFAKKRGLQVEDMCRSEWVYKRLRRFRAGIEAGISWIKRCFGLTRCTWKGLRSFKSYVWASIVSANLLTIARKQLA